MKKHETWGKTIRRGVLTKLTVLGDIIDQMNKPMPVTMW